MSIATDYLDSHHLHPVYHESVADFPILATDDNYMTVVSVEYDIETGRLSHEVIA